jgi:hypothetical protein
VPSLCSLGAMLLDARPRGGAAAREAETLLAAALARAPGHPDALASLARLKQVRAPAPSRAGRSGGRSADARGRGGGGGQEAGEAGEARELFDEALLAAPAHVGALNGLGTLLHARALDMSQRVPGERAAREAEDMVRKADSFFKRAPPRPRAPAPPPRPRPAPAPPSPPARSGEAAAGGG